MTTMQDPAAIKDVSDTAIWVAQYRARETERPDAMFRDPLAKVLVGDRGEAIAQSFGKMGAYVEWTVLARTVNIDEFILDGIRDGVDAVLNIGAGLDTRPYRMELPASLLWVEADFPHMVQFKSEKLAAHTPRCQLQRVSVDLADDAARRSFLASVLPDAKKVLVLTEGVVLYLDEQQVAKLAADLKAHSRFAFWLAEYMGGMAHRYLKAAPRMKIMANAPFRFLPADWEGFFRSHGWVPREIRYASSVAARFKRQPSIPWRARIMRWLLSKEQMERMKKMSGFMLMTPAAEQTLPNQ
jgi:methyltransferase (TIGR00027 family)